MVFKQVMGYPVFKHAQKKNNRIRNNTIEFQINYTGHPTRKTTVLPRHSSSTSRWKRSSFQRRLQLIEKNRSKKGERLTEINKTKQIEIIGT